MALAAVALVACMALGVAEAGLEASNEAGPLYVVATMPDGAQRQAAFDAGLYARASDPTWTIHAELEAATGCQATLNGADQVGEWTGYVAVAVAAKDCSFRVRFTALDGVDQKGAYLYVGHVALDAVGVWVPLGIFVAMFIAAAVWGNPIMLILSFIGILGRFTATDIMPDVAIFVFSALTTAAYAVPGQIRRMLASWQERRQRRNEA